jgi:hypothetical protein
MTSRHIRRLRKAHNEELIEAMVIAATKARVVTVKSDTNELQDISAVHLNYPSRRNSTNCQNQLRRSPHRNCAPKASTPKAISASAQKIAARLIKINIKVSRLDWP